MTENTESERAVTDADQVFLRKCANQPSGLYQLISADICWNLLWASCDLFQIHNTPKIFRITRYILYSNNIVARISFQKQTLYFGCDWTVSPSSTSPVSSIYIFFQFHPWQRVFWSTQLSRCTTMCKIKSVDYSCAQFFSPERSAAMLLAGC